MQKDGKKKPFQKFVTKKGGSDQFGENVCWMKITSKKETPEPPTKGKKKINLGIKKPKSVLVIFSKNFEILTKTTKRQE